MKNILLVLIPSFIAYACAIGAIVYEFIKKSNYHWLKIIFFAGIMLFLVISDIPCYKDISEKETKKVVAEYVKFQSSNTLPCTRKAFFKSEGDQIYVYVPIFTHDIAKMEIGKTYQVEYFCNSHVIKEYKLLEQCK